MNKLPFTKRNYQLMIAGLLVIMAGFALMASSNAPYGFDFIGITLSPIIVIIGFIIEFFAILYYQDKKN